MKKVILFTVFLLLSATSWAETVLMFRQGSLNYEKVMKEVRSELSGDHKFIDVVINASTSYADFSTQIRKNKPALMILLDNQAVDLAMRFNQEKDAYARNLKSVAAMGLNLRKILKDNKNICAVEFEVSAYSVITQYRYIVNKALKEVLVFYRASEHKSMIDVATKQLQKEGIKLRAVNTEARGKKRRDVEHFMRRNFLRELYRKDVDVVWVLSDSGLVNKLTFTSSWIKGSKLNRVPFIAGIDSFVEKDMDFCSYSASPNLKDLGGQVAELALSIVEDDEDPAEIGVEYILSVLKSVNLPKLQANKVNVKMDKLKDVKVIK